MAEYRSILDMANNAVNIFWKKGFSQNVAPLAAVEVFTAGMLNKLKLAWLPSHAPGFYINSKQVRILHEPQSFYKLLLEQIEKAQKRIVLASLYLGNGSLEENLIATLKKRLEEKPDLKVKILLDCTRGSRGNISSRKMIIPLLKDFEKSCQVSLYQTPSLKGPLVQFFPEKYKEIVGLQHIKVYLFDDNFIITGANLSTDYFTKRQDRYMFISDSNELSNFIEGLVDTVSEFSFCLDKENKLSLSESWLYDPFETDPKVFNFAAANLIRNYYESFIGKSKTDEDDTIIFPLLEMGPLGIHTDSEVTIKMLKNCTDESLVYLTTGYFNLTRSYINTIIHQSRAHFRMMMAHPTANGFYKAGGPAGGIPDAYTSIALKFLDEVVNSNQTSRIRMLEYKRPGWTYHAKGLWMSSLKFPRPFLTMIGSPNFGERSVKRDLECQFLLATTNEQLQGDLLLERDSLYKSCLPFTKAVTETDPERKTPIWVEISNGIQTILKRTGHWGVLCARHQRGGPAVHRFFAPGTNVWPAVNPHFSADTTVV